MSGLFKDVGFPSSAAPEAVKSAAANSSLNSQSRGQSYGGRNTVVNFPKRPDLSVLSETIPLFYIARNGHGFWVAREAAGRCGGAFLSRRSAVRYARHQSAPGGCALMFLNETLELDIENEGSRLVEPVAAFVDVVARRAPKLAIFVSLAIAEWRKLVLQIARALAGERRNRKIIERDLFRGEYMLASKNDDDLPIP